MIFWLVITASAEDVCSACPHDTVQGALSAGLVDLVLTDAADYAPFSVSGTTGVVITGAVGARIVSSGGPAVVVDAGAEVTLVDLRLTSVDQAALVVSGASTIVQGEGLLIDASGSALGDGGGLWVGGGATVELSDSQIAACLADRGGGLYLEGASSSVRLERVELWGNVAVGLGGGIAIQDGSLVLVDTDLWLNQADVGGAIWSSDAVVALEGATLLRDNLATRAGGALAASGGTLDVSEGAEVSDNQALAEGGGGLYLEATAATLAGTHVSGNVAATSGGGIQLVGGSLDLARCTLEHNTAALGGHLQLGSASVSDVGSRLEGGRAGVGGALDARFLGGAPYQVSLLDSELLGNQADSGGAVSLEGLGDVILDGVIGRDNAAIAGDGGLLRASGPIGLSVLGGVYTDNTSSIDGGHLSVSGAGPIHIEGVEVSGGRADSGGFAWIDLDPFSELAVSDGVFSGTTASIDGAVFEISGGQVQLLGNTFADTLGAGTYGAAVDLYEVASAELRRNTYCRTASPAGSGGGLAILGGCGSGCSLSNEGFALPRAQRGGAVWVGGGGVVSLAHATVVGSRADQGGAFLAEAGSSLWIDALVAHDVGEQPFVGVQLGQGNVDPGSSSALSGHPGLTRAQTSLLQGADLAGAPCDVELRLHPDSALVGVFPEEDGSYSDLGAFDGPHRDPAWWADADADGDAWSYDCDDADPVVGGGHTESCINGIDDDCNGLIDDGQGAWSPRWSDGDGDGAGDLDQAPFEDCGPIHYGQAATGGDCDDSDATIFPGADELCDGVDQDCDGAVDDDALDGTPHAVDLDGDGYVSRASGIVLACAPSGDLLPLDGGPEDCAEGDPQRSPAALEVPGDGIDQDCDGHDGLSWLAGGSCGCHAAGAPPVGWLLLGLALTVRRGSARSSRRRGGRGAPAR